VDYQQISYKKNIYKEKKMNFLDNTLIGYFTLAAGVSALLQVTFLTLMFTVSNRPFGTISDYFYALTPLLILPLFFSLRQSTELQQTGLSQILLIIGIIGLLIASITQVVLLIKIINYKQSVLGNIVGTSLMGITILAYAASHLNSALPSGFTWFGISLGAVMLSGFITAAFFLDKVTAMSSGQFTPTNTSPLMSVAVWAGMLAQIGLPIWLLWAARLLLNGTLKIVV